MRVYEHGTRDTTILGGIDGIVTAILIRFNSKIQYEFVYFHKGERYSEWVEECELDFAHKATTRNIGFKTGQ